MDLGTCIVHYEGRANLEVDSLFIKLDLIFFFAKTNKYMFRSDLSSKHVFVFVFLTNMQVNLACQTSFSLAVFGKFFFHNRKVKYCLKTIYIFTLQNY